MTEIKKAVNSDDLKRIAKLANIIWHEHFPPIIGEAQVDYMVSKFQSFEAISTAVKENNYIYYMAFDNGELCGYIGIHPEGNAVLLSKIYIEKSHRGKKISRQMIETVQNEFSDYDYMWLTVNKHNDNSVAAYKKMGFEITGEQVADIGNGFVMDDYIMEKKIK